MIQNLLLIIFSELQYSLDRLCFILLSFIFKNIFKTVFIIVNVVLKICANNLIFGEKKRFLFLLSLFNYIFMSTISHHIHEVGVIESLNLFDLTQVILLFFFFDISLLVFVTSELILLKTKFVVILNTVFHQDQINFTGFL